jgi:TonB family protein
MLVLVEVSAAGAPVSVVVRESSGSALLDAHALEWVRRNWTWGTGSPRRFLIPFVFQLR